MLTFSLLPLPALAENGAPPVENEALPTEENALPTESSAESAESQALPQEDNAQPAEETTLTLTAWACTPGPEQEPTDTVSFGTSIDIRAELSGEGAPDFDDPESIVGSIKVFDASGTLLVEGGFFHPERCFNAIIPTYSFGLGSHTLTVRYYAPGSDTASAETTVTVTVVKSSLTVSIHFQEQDSYPHEVTYTGSPIPFLEPKHIEYYLDGCVVNDETIRAILYEKTQIIWTYCPAGVEISSGFPVEVGDYMFTLRVSETPFTSGAANLNSKHDLKVTRGNFTITAPKQALYVFDKSGRHFTFDLNSFLGKYAEDSCKKTFSYKSVSTNIKKEYFSGDYVQVESNLLKLYAPRFVEGSFPDYATLEFTVESRNYTIHLYVPFSYTCDMIEGEIAVTMDGWTYGDMPNSPVFTAPESAGEPVISYKSSGGRYYSDAPTDAGDYTVTVTCTSGSTVY